MQLSKQIVVVKIGGSTLGAHDTSLADVAALYREGLSPIVIHGGGAIVTQWMERSGIKAEFFKGLRITDAASLEVVIAVLSGLINKQLVGSLFQFGVQAIGISGADGNLLSGDSDNPELGLVASHLDVNPEPITAIVKSGYIPIIAPLALSRSPQSDGNMFLNVNADTAAGSIAAALHASRLVFLTDVDGVLGPDGRLIKNLTVKEGEALINSGVIQGGMIPKIRACIHASTYGTSSHMVNGMNPAALLNCINGHITGTSVQLG
jgi:acetylglutamate kinase